MDFESCRGRVCPCCRLSALLPDAVSIFAVRPNGALALVYRKTASSICSGLSGLQRTYKQRLKRESAACQIGSMAGHDDEGMLDEPSSDIFSR